MRIDWATVESTSFVGVVVMAKRQKDVPAEPAVKGALNDAVTKLHDGKMDYGLFYNTINQHIQGADRGSSFKRARIEGQRKQEYNKDERKRGRNERYRG